MGKKERATPLRQTRNRQPVRIVRGGAGPDDNGQTPIMLWGCNPYPTQAKSLPGLRRELRAAARRLAQARDAGASALQNLLDEASSDDSVIELDPMTLQPLAAATRSFCLLVDRAEELPFRVMPLRYPLVIELHYLEEVIERAMAALHTLQTINAASPKRPCLLRRARVHLGQAIEACDNIFLQTQLLVRQSYIAERYAYRTGRQATCAGGVDS